MCGQEIFHTLLVSLSGLEFKMTDVFIAWVGFQRRAEVMKNYWGYDLIHLKNKYKDKKFKI